MSYLGLSSLSGRATLTDTKDSGHEYLHDITSLESEIDTMPYGDPRPVDNTAQFYQLQTQIAALRETVERQGRTIDALIASIPQLSQQAPGAPTGGGRSASAGKVYREWVSWLEMNGPAYRQTLMDAVGKPLPGNQPVVDWRSVMATWPDDSMPMDTMCKINGVSTGQGRPPTVYFLWSQRFDVYGQFGVGPTERPAMVATEPEVLLGVVHPPVTADTVPLEEQEIRNPEPEVETPQFTRCANMDEWNERWIPLFDIFAKHGDKPTEDEKEEMRMTLPEDTGGDPWNVVLARTLYEAKVRLDG